MDNMQVRELQYAKFPPFQPWTTKDVNRNLKDEITKIKIDATLFIFTVKQTLTM